MPLSPNAEATATGRKARCRIIGGAGAGPGLELAAAWDDEGSYEPLGGCGRRFRFGVEGAGPDVGLEIVVARVRQVAERVPARRAKEPC